MRIACCIAICTTHTLNFDNVQSCQSMQSNLHFDIAVVNIRVRFILGQLTLMLHGNNLRSTGGEQPLTVYRGSVGRTRKVRFSSTCLKENFMSIKHVTTKTVAFLYF